MRYFTHSDTHISEVLFQDTLLIFDAPTIAGSILVFKECLSAVAIVMSNPKNSCQISGCARPFLK